MFLAVPRVNVHCSSVPEDDTDNFSVLMVSQQSFDRTGGMLFLRKLDLGLLGAVSQMNGCFGARDLH